MHIIDQEDLIIDLKILIPMLTIINIQKKRSTKISSFNSQWYPCYSDSSDEEENSRQNNIIRLNLNGKDKLEMIKKLNIC